MQQRMRPEDLQGRRAPSYQLPEAELWTREAARPTKKKATQIPTKTGDRQMAKDQEHSPVG